MLQNGTLHALVPKIVQRNILKRRIKTSKPSSSITKFFQRHDQNENLKNQDIQTIKHIRDTALHLSRRERISGRTDSPIQMLISSIIIYSSDVARSIFFNIRSLLVFRLRKRKLLDSVARAVTM